MYLIRFLHNTILKIISINDQSQVVDNFLHVKEDSYHPVESFQYRTPTLLTFTFPDGGTVLDLDSSFAEIIKQYPLDNPPQQTTLPCCH
jgi:hypothetical protein